MGLGLGMKIDGWPPVGWDPNATPVRAAAPVADNTQMGNEPQ